MAILVEGKLSVTCSKLCSCIVTTVGFKLSYFSWGVFGTLMLAFDAAVIVGVVRFGSFHLEGVDVAGLRVFDLFCHG